MNEMGGMVSGLVMGMVQVRCLSEQRHLWWILSDLAWGLAVALILAFKNVMTLFTVNSDFYLSQSSEKGNISFPGNG
jgi:hypothetical protein